MIFLTRIPEEIHVEKRGSTEPKTGSLLAGLLFLSFFLPWVYSMGVPVPAHEIRDRLAGPHRLVSIFTSGSRLSRDYSLALYLYAIPIWAMVLLMLLFLRRYQAWAAFLAGAITVCAFIFLRGEVDNYPMHRLAAGAYLALASGLGLAVLPLFRLGSSAKRG
jgi:hypothetical protein